MKTYPHFLFSPAFLLDLTRLSGQSMVLLSLPLRLAFPYRKPIVWVTIDICVQFKAMASSALEKVLGEFCISIVA